MFPWNMFPFGDKKNMMQNMNPQDIEKHVKELISQAMPQQWQGMFNHDDMMKRAMTMFNSPNQQEPDEPSSSNLHSQSINADVYETFDDIYIRIPINDEEWLKQVKILHTSNQAIIENIPNQGQRHVITLPTLVKRKGTVAQYKDQVLEIRLSKNADINLTEVDVSEKI